MERMKNTEQQRRRWYGKPEGGRVVSGIERVSRVTRHSAATGGQRGHWRSAQQAEGRRPQESHQARALRCGHLQGPSSLPVRIAMFRAW